MADAISFSRKVETVKSVRKAAAQACLQTFQRLRNSGKKVSEQKFTNTWHKFMEKRDKKFWPQIKSYLDSQGGGYVFASPFYFMDDIPLIGDFGFSFYTGSDPEIVNHYKKCVNLITLMIRIIRVGLKFSSLYDLSFSLMKENGLENLIVSSTDALGINIGHTIPFIDKDPLPSDMEKIRSGEEVKIYETIGKNRTFINKSSDYEISQNCVFTFEPRLVSMNNPGLPMFSFHQIIVIKNGEMEVLDNFQGINNFLNPDYNI